MPTTLSRRVLAPHESLEKAFITALLLTASVEAAETAVLKGIESWTFDTEPGEALIKGTVTAALDMRHEVQVSDGELKRRSGIVLWELEPVMYLSPHIRRCFVLRILLGWSRETCARLLHVDTRQIDARTRIAVVRLAYITDVFLSARTTVAGKA